MKYARWLLVICALLGAPAAAQQPKPSDSHHADPPAERRTGLAEQTASITSELPFASEIPVRRQNIIDDLIFAKMERDKIPHAGLSGDPEFLRRVTLDLTGRLPEVDAIRKFVADK